MKIHNYLLFHMKIICLKETRNSFKKWSLNLWYILNKAIMEVQDIAKAAILKSFIHLSYKNTQLLFMWQCLLIFFMRRKLTDDFWRLHKNMNCAFPLEFHIKTPFTFWDMRTWVCLFTKKKNLNVCLQTFRNNRIC